jgi:hypothetical protein
LKVLGLVFYHCDAYSMFLDHAQILAEVKKKRDKMKNRQSRLQAAARDNIQGSVGVVDGRQGALGAARALATARFKQIAAEFAKSAKASSDESGKVAGAAAARPGAGAGGGEAAHGLGNQIVPREMGFQHDEGGDQCDDDVADHARGLRNAFFSCSSSAQDSHTTTLDARLVQSSAAVSGSALGSVESVFDAIVPATGISGMEGGMGGDDPNVGTTTFFRISRLMPNRVRRVQPVGVPGFAPEEMIVTFHNATTSPSWDPGGDGSAVTLDVTPGALRVWSTPACESIPALSRCLQLWQPSSGGDACEDLIFDVPEFVVPSGDEQYGTIIDVIRTMVASGPFVVFGKFPHLRMCNDDDVLWN